MSKSKSIPKVVVVTRTKGRKNLLRRAVESVDNQTFSDFVHIVVNDGGNPKDVEEVLSNFQSKNRLVIHNKKSVGGTVALNQGIRQVNTKYVAIIDDDDSWSIDRLEIAVKYMEDNKSVGSVSAMNKIEEKIDENGKIEQISVNRWRPDITEINLYEQCLENHLSNGCFMYLRSIFDELGGYDETLDVAEDWDFGLRFLKLYDIDFIKTKSALVNYHLRPTAKGVIGNTVFDGIDKHKRDINKILNKNLRIDLFSGSLGVGYIMNNLKFSQKNNEVSREFIINNTVRLEGHVNRTKNEIVGEIHGINDKRLIVRLKNSIKKISSSLFPS